MARTRLDTFAQTNAFGAVLASSLLKADCPPLLLSGPLGCGKTALAASICAALPGGADAEISSPSFTICNVYPCHPPVLHCDFYRCGFNYPDEIYEFLENQSGLLIVEWPGSLAAELNEYLDISFNVVNHAREIEIHAQGFRGARAMAALASVWQLN